MRILLTNDDGIDAPGLKALEAALRALGEVLVVAPATEQSAKSHAFTMHEPLRVDERAPGWVAVGGTPADCVYVGVHHLCRVPPDVVVSGINHGCNLGDDVHYSGTVAAAKEAALIGIPALAVSTRAGAQATAGGPPGPVHWDTAAALALRVVQALVRDPPERGVFLNLNVPNVPPDPLPELRVASLGRRRYRARVLEHPDPRGRKWVWIGGEHAAFCDTPETDGWYFARGFATLTPLQPDHTATGSLARVNRWLMKTGG